MKLHLKVLQHLPLKKQEHSTHRYRKQTGGHQMGNRLGRMGEKGKRD